MDINDVITRVREIAHTHYEGMKANNIDNEPAMLKKDLVGELRAKSPALQDSYITKVYNTLQERGDITLITNDTITFSKDFAG